MHVGPTMRSGVLFCEPVMSAVTPLARRDSNAVVLHRDREPLSHTRSLQSESVPARVRKGAVVLIRTGSGCSLVCPAFHISCDMHNCRGESGLQMSRRLQMLTSHTTAGRDPLSEPEMQQNPLPQRP